MNMPTAPPESVPLPHTIGTILHQAFEEVFGDSGLSALKALAGLDHWLISPDDKDVGPAIRFEDLSGLYEALERRYGSLAGRGLALRTGRALFHYGLREYGASMGISGLGFRLLPLSKKIETGFRAIAKSINQSGDPMVQLREEAEAFFLEIGRCPVCWQRKVDAPCCHMSVGVLQEALYWVSGGKHFHVEEVSCCAIGDPTCTIRVAREPLC
jgi:predicted hydrocarbon binding protein